MTGGKSYLQQPTDNAMIPYIIIYKSPAILLPLCADIQIAEHHVPEGQLHSIGQSKTGYK
jgi:hypothetical protein